MDQQERRDQHETLTGEKMWTAHDFHEAKMFLLTARTLTPMEQVAAKDGIINAFRCVWAAELTPKEFSAIVSGITLFPEMLYIIAGRG